jgi:hypothetical protein
MTDDIETIRDWAQTVLSSLNFPRPDTAITILQTVLERFDPDSPDAEVIKRAIERREEIAREITEVESLLLRPTSLLKTSKTC